ncbi:MAG: Brp/Blh family beta-carotene 15,15'-dioxygenase [Verrucomicrobia bacterium]|nr:Brp/Blh family beta-carotene 15,15'-dioxygenase [Verrucomicrobiota bacterium]
MNALRVQGIVFSAGALLVALGTLALGRLSPQLELIVVAVLILVLGVPHGALDTIFARQLYGIRTLSGWLQFSLLYLLLAALVVGLWLWQPGLFLLGFLAISAAHFSGDPLQGVPWPARLFYGGSVILLPTVGHAQEIGRLFGLLVGDATAAPIVPWLRWLAWPWLVGLALASLWQTRHDFWTALEMAAAGILAIVAPPLVSFVVFFCGMHSARHILRTMNFSGRSSWRYVAGAALLPMAGVLVGSALAWVFLRDTALDARVVQVVFVGLAALTVPHMVLVERVRLSGWIREKIP